MINVSSVRASVVALAAVGCLTGASLAVSTQTAAVVGTDTVGTWFSNDLVASVSHVGPAGTDATVRLDDVVGKLSVVELDGVAYIQDENGTLSRIDPAQLDVSQSTTLPSLDTRLVAGGGHLYALESNMVRELDPVTLAMVAEPLELDGELGAAVVAPDGTLWTADESGGRVLEIAGGEQRSERAVGEPGSGLMLSAVVDDVVVVDPVASSATVVDGPDSGDSHALALAAAATVQVPTVVGYGSVLPLLTSESTLVLLDLARSDVVAVDLGVTSHELGIPQVTESKAYVPDYSDGALVVVDLASKQLDPTITVTGRPGAFDTVVDASTLYVNEPNGERAWAIDDAGVVTPTTKYDPNDPGDGSVRPVTVPAAPPVTAAPPEPDPADTTPASTPSTTTPVANQSGGDVRLLDPPANPRPPTTQPPIVVPVVPPRTPPGGTTGGGNGGGGNGGGGNGAGTTTTVATPDTGSLPIDSDPAATLPSSTTTTTSSVPGTTTTTSVPDTTTTTSGPTTTSTSTTSTTTTTSSTTTTSTTTTTTLPAPPGAPRNVSASAGNGQATVSWVAPGGGTAAASYVVRNLTSGTTQPVSGGTSAIVSGLVNGTSYSFDVTALSAASVAGAASPASNAVTPAGPPAAPAITGGSATGPTGITVTFDAAGSSNGTTVTGWRVTTSPASSTQNVGSGSASFTGLAPRTTYTVNVVALGAGGVDSPASTTTITTTDGLPGAIASIDWSGGTASWSPSAGATGYSVDVDGVQSTTTATSAPVSRPLPGESITVTVTPFNGYGNGPSVSRQVNGGPIQPPPCPPPGGGPCQQIP